MGDQNPQGPAPTDPNAQPQQNVNPELQQGAAPAAAPGANPGMMGEVLGYAKAFKDMKDADEINFMRAHQEMKQRYNPTATSYLRVPIQQFKDQMRHGMPSTITTMYNHELLHLNVDDMTHREGWAGLENLTSPDGQYLSIPVNEGEDPQRAFDRAMVQGHHAKQQYGDYFYARLFDQMMFNLPRHLGSERALGPTPGGVLGPWLSNHRRFQEDFERDHPVLAKDAETAAFWLSMALWDVSPVGWTFNGLLRGSRFVTSRLLGRWLGSRAGVNFLGRTSYMVDAALRSTMNASSKYTEGWLGMLGQKFLADPASRLWTRAFRNMAPQRFAALERQLMEMGGMWSAERGIIYIPKAASEGAMKETYASFMDGLRNLKRMSGGQGTITIVREPSQATAMLLSRELSQGVAEMGIHTVADIGNMAVAGAGLGAGHTVPGSVLEDHPQIREAYKRAIPTAMGQGAAFAAGLGAVFGGGSMAAHLLKKPGTFPNIDGAFTPADFQSPSGPGHLILRPTWGQYGAPGETIPTPGPSGTGIYSGPVSNATYHTLPIKVPEQTWDAPTMDQGLAQSLDRAVKSIRSARKPAGIRAAHNLIEVARSIVNQVQPHADQTTGALVPPKLAMERVQGARTLLDFVGDTGADALPGLEDALGTNLAAAFSAGRHDPEYMKLLVGAAKWARGIQDYLAPRSSMRYASRDTDQRGMQQLASDVLGTGQKVDVQTAFGRLKSIADEIYKVDPKAPVGAPPEVQEVVPGVTPPEQPPAQFSPQDPGEIPEVPSKAPTKEMFMSDPESAARSQQMYILDAHAAQPGYLGDISYRKPEALLADEPVSIRVTSDEEGRTLLDVQGKTMFEADVFDATNGFVADPLGDEPDAPRRMAGINRAAEPFFIPSSITPVVMKLDDDTERLIVDQDATDKRAWMRNLWQRLHEPFSNLPRQDPKDPVQAARRVFQYPPRTSQEAQNRLNDLEEMTIRHNEKVPPKDFARKEVGPGATDLDVQLKHGEMLQDHAAIGSLLDAAKASLSDWMIWLSQTIPLALGMTAGIGGPRIKPPIPDPIASPGAMEFERLLQNKLNLPDTGLFDDLIRGGDAQTQAFRDNRAMVPHSATYSLDGNPVWNPRGAEGINYPLDVPPSFRASEGQTGGRTYTASDFGVERFHFYDQNGTRTGWPEQWSNVRQWVYGRQVPMKGVVGLLLHPNPTDNPRVQDHRFVDYGSQIITSAIRDKGDEGAGALWYEQDVDRTADMLRDIIPGVPLTDNRRNVFKSLLAVLSYQSDVQANFSQALYAYLGWLKTGRIPTHGPYGGGSWGSTTSTTKMNKLRDLQALMDLFTSTNRWKDMGAERGGMGGLYDLLVEKRIPLGSRTNPEPGTVRYLEMEMDRRAGHRVTPKGWTSRIPAVARPGDPMPPALAFGPKGGIFLLNQNGKYDLTTVDTWVKTFHNITGGTMETLMMNKGDGTSIETPSQRVPNSLRLRMWENFRKMGDMTGLPPAAAQAVLWEETIQMADRAGLARRGTARRYSDAAKRYTKAGFNPTTLDPTDFTDKRKGIWVGLTDARSQARLDWRGGVSAEPVGGRGTGVASRLSEQEPSLRLELNQRQPDEEPVEYVQPIPPEQRGMKSHPFYALPKGELQLLQRYSRRDREEALPELHGSPGGVGGAERKRRENYGGLYVPRTYFYEADLPVEEREARVKRLPYMKHYVYPKRKIAQYEDFMGMPKEYARLVPPAEAVTLAESRAADQGTALRTAQGGAPKGTVVVFKPLRNLEAMAKQMLSSLDKDGGFSYDVVEGRTFSRKEGYMIGAHKDEGRTLVIDRKDLTPEAIVEWIGKNLDVLGHPDVVMGGWIHPDTGKVEIEPAQWFRDFSDAYAAAQVREQHSIWDLKDKTDIPAQGEEPPISRLSNEDEEGFSDVEHGMFNKATLFPNTNLVGLYHTIRRAFASGELVAPAPTYQRRRMPLTSDEWKARMSAAPEPIEANYMSVLPEETLALMEDLKMALYHDELVVRGRPGVARDWANALNTMLDQPLGILGPADEPPKSTLAVVGDDDEHINVLPGFEMKRTTMIVQNQVIGDPKKRVKGLTKELLQNAIDAVQLLLKVTPIRGDAGVRCFLVHEEIADLDTGNWAFKDVKIRMEDDGVGMPPDVLQKQYVDIGSTHMKGATTGGAFGGANVAVIGMSEHISVETMALPQRSFNGTHESRVPDTVNAMQEEGWILLSDMPTEGTTDQHDLVFVEKNPTHLIYSKLSGNGQKAMHEGVPLKQSKIPLRVPINEMIDNEALGYWHGKQARPGTVVELKLPDFQGKSYYDNGGIYEARQYMETALAVNQLPFEIEYYQVGDSGSIDRALRHGKRQIERDRMEHVKEIDTPSFSFDLYKSEAEDVGRSTSVTVLNNGVPLFTMDFPRNIDNPWEHTDGPKFINVDIHPKVGPTDPSGGYPYDFDRSHLRDSAEGPVSNAVATYIMQSYVARSFERYRRAFTDPARIPSSTTNKAVIDPSLTDSTKAALQDVVSRHPGYGKLADLMGEITDEFKMQYGKIFKGALRGLFFYKDTPVDLEKVDFWGWSGLWNEGGVNYLLSKIFKDDRNAAITANLWRLYAEAVPLAYSWVEEETGGQGTAEQREEELAQTLADVLLGVILDHETGHQTARNEPMLAAQMTLANRRWRRLFNHLETKWHDKVVAALLEDPNGTGNILKQLETDFIEVAALPTAQKTALKQFTTHLAEAPGQSGGGEGSVVRRLAEGGGTGSGEGSVEGPGADGTEGERASAESGGDTERHALRAEAQAWMAAGGGWSRGRGKKLFAALTDEEKYRAVLLNITSHRIRSEHHLNALNPARWAGNKATPGGMGFFGDWRPTPEQKRALQDAWNIRNDQWRTARAAAQKATARGARRKRRVDQGKVGEAPEGPPAYTYKDFASLTRDDLDEMLANDPYAFDDLNRSFWTQVPTVTEEIANHPDVQAREAAMAKLDMLKDLMRDVGDTRERNAPHPAYIARRPISGIKKAMIAADAKLKTMMKAPRFLMRPMNVVGPGFQAPDTASMADLMKSGTLENESVWYDLYSAVFDETNSVKKAMNDFSVLLDAASLGGGEVKHPLHGTISGVDLDKKIFRALRENLPPEELDRPEWNGFKVKLGLAQKTHTINFREWIPKIRERLADIISKSERSEIHHLNTIIGKHRANSYWFETHLKNEQLKAARNIDPTLQEWEEIEALYGPDFLTQIDEALKKNGAPDPSAEDVSYIHLGDEKVPVVLGHMSYKAVASMLAQDLGHLRKFQKRKEDIKNGSLRRRGYIAYIHENAVDEVRRELKDPHSLYSVYTDPKVKTHFLESREKSDKEPFNSFVTSWFLYIPAIYRQIHLQPALTRTMGRMQTVPKDQKPYLESWVATLRGYEDQYDQMVNKAAYEAFIEEPTLVDAVIKAASGLDMPELIREAKKHGEISTKLWSEGSRTMSAIGYLALLGPKTVAQLTATEPAFWIWSMAMNPSEWVPDLWWVPSSIAKGTGQATGELASWLAHKAVGTPRWYSEATWAQTVDVVHEMIQAKEIFGRRHAGDDAWKNLMRKTSFTWFWILRASEFLLRAPTYNLFKKRLAFQYPDANEDFLIKIAAAMTNNLIMAYGGKEATPLVSNSAVRWWLMFKRWVMGKMELGYMGLKGSTEAAGYGLNTGAKRIDEVMGTNFADRFPGRPMPSRSGGHQGMMPPPPPPPTPPGGGSGGDFEDDEWADYAATHLTAAAKLGAGWPAGRRASMKWLLSVILGMPATAAGIYILYQIVFASNPDDASYQKINPLDPGDIDQIPGLFLLADTMKWAQLKFKRELFGTTRSEERQYERALRELLYDIPIYGRMRRQADREDREYEQLLRQQGLKFPGEGPLPPLLPGEKRGDEMEHLGLLWRIIQWLDVSRLEKKVSKGVENLFPEGYGKPTSPPPVLSPAEREAPMNFEPLEEGE